jgi:hypothetical protein
VRDVGAPAEEQRARFLQLRQQRDADVVVPVGHRPNAVGEAAVAFLVLSSWRWMTPSSVMNSETMSFLMVFCLLCRDDERGNQYANARGNFPAAPPRSDQAR